MCAVAAEAEPSPHAVTISSCHFLMQCRVLRTTCSNLSADRMGNERNGRREERAQRDREGERESGRKGEVERGRKRGRKGGCKERGCKERVHGETVQEKGRPHQHKCFTHTLTVHLHTCTDAGPKTSAEHVSCLLPLSFSLAQREREREREREALASSHSSPMKETRACA